ncbi:MAG: EndoU domain-containing protein [Clostridium sp.]
MIKNLRKNIILLVILMFTTIFLGCNSNEKVDEKNATKNESQIQIKDVSELKNTENFKSGALAHILEGEINSKGQAVGFHYENMPNSKGKVIKGTESKENEKGVYTAKVEVDGIKKTSNGGKSSFFPKDWSAQKVVDTINEAFKEKVYKTGNTYFGYSKDGVKIVMYIDEKTDRIISAFPEY